MTLKRPHILNRTVIVSSIDIEHTREAKKRKPTDVKLIIMFLSNKLGKAYAYYSTKIQPKV